LAEYAGWLRAGGSASSTVYQRHGHLRRFAREAGVADPWSVTVGDCAVWLGVEHWAPETRKSAQMSLRSFYRWAVTFGYVAGNPAELLPRVRTFEPPPRPAPDHAVAAAFDGADDRTRLIIAFGVYAGLRRGEIARLRWSDAGEGFIRVNGKGGKVRTVPLHPTLRDLLEAELARRAAGDCGTGYRYRADLGIFVFPGRHGGPSTSDAIGRTAARALGRGFSSHTLRHRFATKAYSAERDLLAVQTLLGHSSPVTTKRYAQVPPGALERAVLAAG
jgi:integrase